MKENRDSMALYNFEFFFELSTDILCIAGYDGYFKKVNPAISKLLGYTNDELFSKPIIEFIYIEDRAITASTREKLTKNKSLLNFENRYLTKSGEIVWLSWTYTPSDNDKLIFAVAKNITHQKKLEEERNLLLANLTRYNKDLKQLTFTTSHDLRSPLNNILAILDLIDVSQIKDKQTLEFIDFLKSASETLSTTLNNSVDILIQKDSLIAQIEDINLKESLNGVLNSINSLIQNSKATINANFSKLEKIKFNTRYLESIFLNLITNSIKYTKHDSLPIISIYSQKNNGVNQLIISDNGLGFDMNMAKDKIFGLHQKFHNHIDSKGVGLYLVHNHITSLGGRIDVESKINEGTIFIISFKD